MSSSLAGSEGAILGMFIRDCAGIETRILKRHDRALLPLPSLSTELGLVATSPEEVAGGLMRRTAGVSLRFSLTSPPSRTNITPLCRRNSLWARFELMRRCALDPKCLYRTPVRW